jgi:hypothetical protein
MSEPNKTGVAHVGTLGDFIALVGLELLGASLENDQFRCVR